MIAGNARIRKGSGMNSRSRWAAGCTPFFLSLLLLYPAAAASGLRVEAGGGVFTPFDSEQREAYDMGGGFQLGLSASVPDSRAEIFFDGGYRKSTGQDLANDPTFELADAEYSLIPIGFGLRGDLFVPRPGKRLSLFAGFTMQHVFTRWEGPFGDSDKTTVFGMALEVRPEYQMDDRWSIWVSQRFSLLGDAAYNNRSDDLDYSASVLMAGVAYQIRGDE